MAKGHTVVCSVRDQHHFSSKINNDAKGNVEIIENDFLKPETLASIPKDIKVAYYLIHSMSSDDGDFTQKEKQSALNFRNAVEDTKSKQVIYLTGIVNETQLSKHLSSRKAVEDSLKSAKYALTALRAAIVVGSGSASFEIIRDLVEKLPVMVAPKWLNTKCTPIGIRNVMQFLVGVKNQTFTIINPMISQFRTC